MIKSLISALTLVVLLSLGGCRDWFPPTDPKDPDPKPPTYDLQGTRWCLASFTTANGAVENVDPALGIYAEFKKNNEISGFGGCNGFGGEYRTHGTQLSIGPLVSTEMYCFDKSRYESRFLLALQGAQSYSIDGKHLKIVHGGNNGAVGGVVLLVACGTVDPPPPGPGYKLTGATWCLRAVDSTTNSATDPLTRVNVDPSLGAHIAFDDNLGVKGYTGCNDFWGRYKLGIDPVDPAGSRLPIRIEQLGGSKRLCQESMWVEAAMLNVLRSEYAAYWIDGDQLFIISDWRESEHIVPVTLVFQACPNDTAGGGNGGGGVDHGTVKLPYRMTVPVEGAGVLMRLSEVQDSRCPLNVLCITEGQADIRIDVTRADGTSVGYVTLRTSGYGPQSRDTALVGDLEVELFQLEPYPMANTPQIVDKYVAYVNVRQK